MVSFLLPLISIFSSLFSRWVGSRAVLCTVDKSTLLFFCCLFFLYFKFCLNQQEKGTANGFVFDSTVFQEADILWLKGSISVVYNIFSLPSIYGVTEAVFKETVLQNWQMD